jgi:ABC-2 type transport system permease protein
VIGLAVRLKLALLRGTLRSGPGSTGRRTALILGGLFGGLLSLLAFGALASLGGTAKGEDTAIVLFTLLVIGWTVLPILTFSSDDLLDASKLALLPLSRRQVLTLHGVGALIGVAPVATALAVSGLIASGSGPLGYVVAVLAAVLELALCIAASRAVAAALSRLLRSRRGRDLGVALTALVAIGGQLLNPVLQRVGASHEASQGLHRLGSALGTLPPGLLASAPRSGALGLLHLLAGAASVAVLLWLWERALRRAEEVPDATTGRRRSERSSLFSGLLPANRIGAVAGKDLRYLAREPRRLVQIVSSTLFPAVFVVLSPALADGSVSHNMVFAVCGIALFFGLSGANRFGQEGTATWLLIASGPDRRAARRDLLGGDLALVLVGLPLIVVAGVVLAVITDGFDRLPAALALAVAILNVGLGGGGILSVLVPYPIPEGPRNAFSNGGGGQGLAAAMLGLLVMAGVALLCLPLLYLLLPSLDGHRTWLLVLVAPVYGVLVGGLARELAARQWALTGPEILLKVNAQR